MKNFLIVCGVLSSLFCLIAGIVAFITPAYAAFGFYFIGKGLFVGPTLIFYAMEKI